MFFVLGKARDITQHGTFCIAGKSCHMYHFCHDKTFLSQQTRLCHNKSSVTTNTLLSRQKMCFVTANTRLSRQSFCRVKKYTRGSSGQRNFGRCADPTFSPFTESKVPAAVNPLLWLQPHNHSTLELKITVKEFK